jgi:hypothetical protein
MKFRAQLALILAMAAVSSPVAAQPKQEKKAASTAAAAPASGPVSIPTDAVEVEPGLFEAKDETGKVWHYTRTPFGVRKFPPERLKDTTAVEAARIAVLSQDGETVKFERKTPFGTTAWSKSKDKLNAAEKLALAKSAENKNATATAKKK